jgi:uncharacterized membrane protein YoaT (DUF817 family)
MMAYISPDVHFVDKIHEAHVRLDLTWAWLKCTAIYMERTITFFESNERLLRLPVDIACFCIFDD